MLAYFKLPVSWFEILKRTAKETINDDCLSLSAQLAYYFLLALFPALLFMVALASFFPIQNLVGQIVDSISQFAPPDVVRIVRDQILEVARSNSGGLLTIGMLMTVWSSSAAIVAIINTLNTAYDITEGRPWWKVRLTAVGLTIALSVFILTSFALLIIGPGVAQDIASRFHLGQAFVWTWSILRWPVIFILVATAIGLVYYFAPDAEQDWVWLTPGSLVATALWILFSIGFKFYLANFADYNATYGAIGGVIVMLLWLYTSGLAILIGAEMNAEIEHASPYGKAPGEKVPGQKKKIGAAAARAYEEQQKHPSPHPTLPRRHGPPAPEPTPANVVTGGVIAALIRLVRGRRVRE